MSWFSSNWNANNWFGSNWFASVSASSYGRTIYATTIRTTAFVYTPLVSTESIVPDVTVYAASSLAIFNTLATIVIPESLINAPLSSVEANTIEVFAYGKEYWQVIKNVRV